ncbi:helix-turn-helix domain-containing protein [Dellaglioa sp. BT-FLS60]
MSDKTTIERIINLREKNNWSQVELGRKIGIEKSTMNKIENGTRNISTEELSKIATCFNVSTDYLLGRVDGPHDDLLVAAHMDDNLTEQQIEEINKFIEFQKQEYIKDRDKKNQQKKD